MPFASFPAQVEFIERIQRYLSRFSTQHYNPWVVVVELLLIGVVVYTVLRFLRGTRGARLVQAVLMILAGSFLLVQVVARDFNLDRINVLYPYFMGGIFLVSLVAFQHELRRMLIRIGETRFFRSWTTQTESVIEPVVRAASALGANKIGALIAIERSTELGAIAEAGVPLDALVTSRLLETIFWPGSALHDLGVIIRRDRIVAAGCQFPLSESGTMDRALGSRHRAAVGVSEEANAVVIVVSEETGTISVAYQGRLRRSLSPDELRRLLIEALAQPKPVPTASDKSESHKEVTSDGSTKAA